MTKIDLTEKQQDVLTANAALNAAIKSGRAVQAHGLDLGDVRRLAAREWGARFGLTLHKDRDWQRLSGRKTSKYPLPDMLAGDDHMYNFAAGRRVVVHITQPYHFGADTLAEMEREAALYGLQFAVLDNEAGWWWPGHTCFAVWTRAGAPILDLIKAGAGWWAPSPPKG